MVCWFPSWGCRNYLRCWKMSPLIASILKSYSKNVVNKSPKSVSPINITFFKHEPSIYFTLLLILGPLQWPHCLPNDSWNSICLQLTSRETIHQLNIWRTVTYIRHGNKLGCTRFHDVKYDCAVPWFLSAHLSPAIVRYTKLNCRRLLCNTRDEDLYFGAKNCR